MNITKKILIILILITCIIFAACSQNDTKTDGDNQPSNNSITDEPAESAKSYYDSLGERNFDGDTFTLLDACHHPNLQVNFPVEEGLNGEPVNDALFIRDKFIEEKYGVELKYIQIPGTGTGCEALEKSVLAGTSDYDLIISPVLGNSLASIATRNVLYNMIDAPYLSLGST
jgi:ABC-type glycerol-3-phosphate transport system substrate-binding protein